MFSKKIDDGRKNVTSTHLETEYTALGTRYLEINPTFKGMIPGGYYYWPRLSQTFPDTSIGVWWNEYWDGCQLFWFDGRPPSGMW